MLTEIEIAHALRFVFLKPKKWCDYFLENDMRFKIQPKHREVTVQELAFGSYLEDQGNEYTTLEHEENDPVRQLSVRYRDSPMMKVVKDIRLKCCNGNLSKVVKLIYLNGQFYYRMFCYHRTISQSQVASAILDKYGAGKGVYIKRAKPPNFRVRGQYIPHYLDIKITNEVQR